MNFLTDISPLIKTLELKQEPIIIVVNEFDEEAATNFSRRSVRCLMAAWIAPSTSDHASMNLHHSPQTYSMPSK